jgi:hypothetical protein
MTTKKKKAELFEGFYLLNKNIYKNLIGSLLLFFFYLEALAC